MVADNNYPGYVQLVTKEHIKELTDLDFAGANEVFAILFKVEGVLRKLYYPDKVNIASLGNMVPHLHWHIIPRYVNDRHFPNPIWGEVTNPSYVPSGRVTLLEQKLISEIKQSLC